VSVPGGADLEIWWAPIPDTPQEEYWDDDTPEGKILLSGGYGSGKTTGLVGKALKLSNINSPRPGIFTVPDYGHFEDTILETIKSMDPDTVDSMGNGRRWFLDDHQFHYRVTRHGLHLFEWEGGGDWHVMSAKQPGSIKGPNRAWGAMDEPGIQSYDAWRNTVMRIRDPLAKLRQMIGAGTPEGLNWLTDTFSEEKGGYYKTYRMTTRQNIELLKSQPDYIQQILQNATDQEAQAYVEGLMVNLSGAMAYGTFARNLHWRLDVPINVNAPLLFSFDFNVDPMSCIVAQKGMGALGPEINVIDAFILNASWTPEVCEQIVKHYGREKVHAQLGFRGRDGWPGGAVVYGDATGGSRSTTSLKSNYDLIKEILGPEFRRGFKLHASVLSRVNPSEADRVNTMNALLLNAKKQTRLWIRKTEPAKLCRTLPLVRSFEKTQKAPGTTNLHKPSGETHTHPSDALGYLCEAELPQRRPLIVSAGSFGSAEV
jgi:hypothetical protein